MAELFLLHKRTSNKMKQIFILISLVALLCTSCRDENSALGANWIESDLRNVQTDTCTVKLSTYLLDSIDTSNQNIAQLGYYKDNMFGGISASSYIGYTRPSFSFDENLAYGFDSLTITMKCNGDYLGDTLAPIKVHLYELTEDIALNSSGYLYNCSNVAHKNTPLSTITIHPKPKGGNMLEYRISDNLGKEWLNKLLENSDDFKSLDTFKHYFKGIAFVPDESDNKSIMGFAINDSSMCIKLYYHEINEASTDYSIDFTPTTPHFNQVKHNKNNTPLQNLGLQMNEVSSEKMSNISYVQGLTGIYTKIDFPYLNNLLEAGKMVSIESAMLYLYPVKGMYGDYNPLPESLALYKSDENNVTESQITDALGTSVQSGSLVVDKDLHVNTYYSFDITSFMQSNLGKVGYNRKSLQLVLPEDKINTSFQSVIFGDMKHPQSNVKLTVLYKIYKTN